MANTGYTSPFPTSHDTIGQSTLVTPLFMPSSPPQQLSSPLGSPVTAETPATERGAEQRNANNDGHDGEDNHSENELQHISRPPTPGSPTGSDLDARLADYTLDFSGFPSGHFAIDGNEDTLPSFHKEVDQLSDVGGPEDFTANMEKYLMGDLEDREHNEDEAEVDYGSVRRSFGKSKQPAIEEEADSVEYSEFGPPVDMSTPSHLLHRPSALHKDSTHLEDIEEYPDDDEAQDSASPSVRKLSDASSHQPEEQHEDLQQRISQLQQALKERDDQLQKNRNRVLEAVSAGEHIRHLQMELQRKNELLEQVHAKDSDKAKLREQIQSLQTQNEDLEKLLHRSSSETDLNPLREQIREMQLQLQARDSQGDMDKERLETIAHLRQQLTLCQEQVRKRDETLDETFAKLKEVTQSKDTQLQQKNSEIDQLQGQIDDYGLENEKLETELERAHNDYQVLEERFIDLETRNRPLEEKNTTLEADLTRVQSHMEAQESALKAAAADLPISGHSTYSEILDLIKDLGHGDPESAPESPFLKDKFTDVQDAPQLPRPDVGTMQQVDIAKLQQELQEAIVAQKASDAEVDRLRNQGSETQTLIKTIETDNSRLSNRVTELTAALNKSQHDLTQAKEEHAESLETIARLQEDKILEPPSPPPSPPTPRGANQDTIATLEANHQTQLRSLQTAHSTSISTLRASHAESIRKIRHLLTTAEQRESTLRNELATLRSTSTASETHLKKSFKVELRRLEAVIAAKDEAAAAVDQRIALSIDKREREWERRIDLLLKERDRMAKVLMMSWGEKEMGRGPGPLAENNGKENRQRDEKSGQAYRYKYAPKQKIRSGESKA